MSRSIFVFLTTAKKSPCPAILLGNPFQSFRFLTHFVLFHFTPSLYIRIIWTVFICRSYPSLLPKNQLYKRPERIDKLLNVFYYIMSFLFFLLFYLLSPQKKRIIRINSCSCSIHIYFIHYLSPPVLAQTLSPTTPCLLSIYSINSLDIS